MHACPQNVNAVMCDRCAIVRKYVCTCMCVCVCVCVGVSELSLGIIGLLVMPDYWGKDPCFTGDF